MPRKALPATFDSRLDSLEDDHRNLKRLLAAVCDGLRGRQSREFTADVLEALHRLVKVHSYTENLLMRLYGFPDCDHHIAEHEALDALVLVIWDVYTLGDSELGLKKLAQFSEMLNEHMNDEDKQLDRHLAEIGAAVK